MNQQSLVTTDFLAMAQSQSDGFYKLTEVKLQIVKIGKTNLKKKQYSTNLQLYDGVNLIDATLHSKTKQKHDNLALFMIIKLWNWKLIWPEPYIYFREWS